MPDPAPAARAWPTPIPVALLVLAVAIDAFLWGLGFWHLLQGLAHIEAAGWPLTGAILFLIVFGWAWRWGVAAGYIGGRPTVRFGGA